MGDYTSIETDVVFEPDEADIEWIKGTSKTINEPSPTGILAGRFRSVFYLCGAVYYAPKGFDRGHGFWRFEQIAPESRFWRLRRRTSVKEEPVAVHQNWLVWLENRNAVGVVSTKWEYDTCWTRSLLGVLRRSPMDGKQPAVVQWDCEDLDLNRAVIAPQWTLIYSRIEDVVRRRRSDLVDEGLLKDAQTLGSGLAASLRQKPCSPLWSPDSPAERIAWVIGRALSEERYDFLEALFAEMDEKGRSKERYDFLEALFAEMDEKGGSGEEIPSVSWLAWLCARSATNPERGSAGDWRIRAQVLLMSIKDHEWKPLALRLLGFVESLL